MGRILVIDDNQDILDAISFVLKRRKFEVVSLNDPSLLSDYISEHKPDVLLMDIAMGLYDGRDLCREIKNTPEKCNMGVILFTAQYYNTESIAGSAADAVIEKPFKIQQLYDTVERLMPVDNNQ
ncbi:twitching motility two-component system response regulator PilH [Chitinophaga rupis]|uniref:Twitching motility two-component system response regulator PilH n=1 Tax=Chitinophaga rupis TaxID=573321 RepID=A0A1H7QZG7_9BACT|nr:response regulator [Chitinophaga rupis]SEL53128.1 twitching motility two-component system response regulator PilH [Chitinophaga rupis]